MYLKQLHIHNNGPIADLALTLEFSADGAPIPIVCVGANGSGKSNLLSLVADALFESSAQHFSDVSRSAGGLSRHWFRMVGGVTTSYGTGGGFALLQFEDDGKTFTYKEKSGSFKPADAAAMVDEKLRPHASWEEEGNVKEMQVSKEDAMSIFRKQVFGYFPSSRHETPHWMNRESIPSEEVSLAPRVSTVLGRPLYVERGLEKIKQWLVSLIVDCRVDVAVVQKGRDFELELRSDPSVALAPTSVLNAINSILKLVLNDSTARVGWGGRKAGTRIGVQTENPNRFIPFDSLSTGQATLLTIFGTLLRYGDEVLPRATPQLIEGVCIVDEIDAHMHMELQYAAIPKLIRMFPKIQFVLSSHAPIFVLGMAKEFQSAVAIVELPSGIAIAAETFSEFERALDVIRETRAFNASVLELAKEPGKLLVLLEGETDPLYLRAAIVALRREDLLEKIEFDWIGSKTKSGQVMHSGKSALLGAERVLRAKPGLLGRPVLLLYDDDTPKTPTDDGLVHVRSLPRNQANTKVEDGIENLLPEHFINDADFRENTIKKPNGGSVTVRELNKVKLCKRLCKGDVDPHAFDAFAGAVDVLSEVLAKSQA